MEISFVWSILLRDAGQFLILVSWSSPSGCKDGKRSCDGVRAVIWGLEGKCGAFGDDLNQKWGISLNGRRIFLPSDFEINELRSLPFILLLNPCTLGFFSGVDVTHKR